MKSWSTSELHIFKDCEDYFAEKLHSFHEEYVDCFLLIGVDAPNKDIESIKMTKNPEFSTLYYKRIIGGIKYVKPIISVNSFVDKKINASCDIYYLNNYEDIEDFYMVQKVGGWQGTSQCCHQVWKLLKENIFDINEHWL